MYLAITGLQALAITRALRTGVVEGGYPTHRAGLLPPNPSPRRRWTRTAIDLGPFAGIIGFDAEHPLQTASPTKHDRVRMSGVTCSVMEHGLPSGSFVPVGGGIHVPCPELLFLEMDRYMEPLPQLMLGLELCGTFSRDPFDPLAGDARLHTPAVTSAKRVRAFAEACGLRSHDQSRMLAECLADGSWSPGEALIGAWAALPFSELGYGAGPIRLNERVEPCEELAPFAVRESRVPDILLAGTKVGINYDGTGHLDLEGVIAASVRLERDPGNSQLERELKATTRGVRDKYVDDRRRERELGAAGYTVFTVTKEDLYEPGGLDRLMGQCLVALRRAGVEGLDAQLAVVRSKAVAGMRRRMLDAVLVGRGQGTVM